MIMDRQRFQRSEIMASTFVNTHPSVCSDPISSSTKRGVSRKSCSNCAHSLASLALRENMLSNRLAIEINRPEPPLCMCCCSTATARVVFMVPTEPLRRSPRPWSRLSRRLAAKFLASPYWYLMASGTPCFSMFSKDAPWKRLKMPHCSSFRFRLLRYMAQSDLLSVQSLAFLVRVTLQKSLSLQSRWFVCPVDFAWSKSGFILSRIAAISSISLSSL